MMKGLKSWITLAAGVGAAALGGCGGDGASRGTSTVRGKETSAAKDTPATPPMPRTTAFRVIASGDHWRSIAYVGNRAWVGSLEGAHRLDPKTGAQEFVVGVAGDGGTTLSACGANTLAAFPEPGGDLHLIDTRSNRVTDFSFSSFEKNTDGQEDPGAPEVGVRTARCSSEGQLLIQRCSSAATDESCDVLLIADRAQPAQQKVIPDAQLITVAGQWAVVASKEGEDLQVIHAGTGETKLLPTGSACPCEQLNGNLWTIREIAAGRHEFHSALGKEAFPIDERLVVENAKFFSIGETFWAVSGSSAYELDTKTGATLRTLPFPQAGDLSVVQGPEGPLLLAHSSELVGDEEQETGYVIRPISGAVSPNGEP